MDLLAATLGPDTQASAEDATFQERDVTGAADDNSPSPQPTRIPSSTAKKPLIETVRSCFSAESPLRKTGQPYLSPSTDRWSRLSSDVQLLSSDKNAISPKLSPADLWTKLKDTDMKYAIILVENITDEWCEALCTRFPQRVNEKFLLEHILGLTLPARCTCDLNTSSTCRVVEADVRSVVQSLAGRIDPQQEDVGFHINYWHEPETAISGSRGGGGCMLRRASESVQSYGFVSCCQLEEHICR
jgi:hypothetical protein